jgi:hypothetical protein
VGRDPASGLVLNDPKCSRKHAVIESSAEGVTIRDNGSANGVFVNGHKIERARIRDGDLIKLGDVLVTLLPEALSGTMIMDGVEGPADARRQDADSGTYAEGTAADMAVVGVAKARSTERTVPELPGPDEPISPAAPLPAWKAFRSVSRDGPAEPSMDQGAATFSRRRRPRPRTVTVLASLWVLSVPLYAIAGLALSEPASGGTTRASIVAGGIGLAAFSAAMALGLWLERRWAYLAQIVVAGLGLFVCPFTLASIALLVYLLRPEVRWHFSDRSEREPDAAGQAETMFAGALLGAVMLGVLLTAALTFLARTARTVPAGRGGRILVRVPAEERAALAQLKAMAAAQDAFRSVCNTGYGDLQALRQPATVIPDYPAEGPAFLRGSGFDEPERDGYRFSLAVEAEMQPAPGCPTRRFRRFLYAATPLGPGRSLAVGPDAVVRAAEGRPATLDDPPAE